MDKFNKRQGFFGFLTILLFCIFSKTLYSQAAKDVYYDWGEDRYVIALALGEEFSIEGQEIEDLKVPPFAEYSSEDTNIAVVSPEGVVTATGYGNTTIMIKWTNPSGKVRIRSLYVCVPELSVKDFSINLGRALEDGEDFVTENRSEVEILYIPKCVPVTVTTNSKKFVAEYDDRDFSMKFYDVGNYKMNIDVDGIEFTLPVYVESFYFKYNKNTISTCSYCDDELKETVHHGSLLLLKKGDSTKLKLDGESNLKRVKWSSTDKSVVTVNQNGVVKAKGNGNACIIATIGNLECKYVVSVTYKEAIAALKYAHEHRKAKYSLEKRMQKGYYDCSSFAWRSYEAAGVYLNKNGGWAPSAPGLAQWCVKNNLVIYEIDSGYEIGSEESELWEELDLLPGDLIFSRSTGTSFMGVYHVDVYMGRGEVIGAMNPGAGVCKWSMNNGNILIARPGISYNLKASKSQNGIKLSWEPQNGEVSYQIYRSTSLRGQYKKIANVKDVLSYEDKSVKNGTLYYYKIRAVYNECENTYYAKYSNIVSEKK